MDDITARCPVPLGAFLKLAGVAATGGDGFFVVWIDRRNGVGGYWATQILPFQDIASYPGFVDFETALYRSLKQ